MENRQEPWTPRDDATLRRMVAEAERTASGALAMHGWSAIAERLGRTASAARSRWEKIGTETTMDGLTERLRRALAHAEKDGSGFTLVELHVSDARALLAELEQRKAVTR